MSYSNPDMEIKLNSPLFRVSFGAIRPQTQILSNCSWGTGDDQRGCVVVPKDPTQSVVIGRARRLLRSPTGATGAGELVTPLLTL